MQLHKMNLVISGSGTGYVKIADAGNKEKPLLLVSFQHDFNPAEREAIVAGVLTAPARCFTAGISQLERKLNDAGTIDRMTEIYEEFLEFTGLPKLSADELLHEPEVDGMNRVWLTAFSLKWEKLEAPPTINRHLAEYLVVGRIHGGSTRALKVHALDAEHAKRVFADTVWAEIQPPIEGAREANTKQYGCDVQIDVVAVGDGIQVVKS